MAAQENKNNSPRPSLDIVAFCQSCGTKHAFDPSVVGQKAKCLTCGHVFRVVDTRKDRKRSRPVKSRTTSPIHSRRRSPAKPAPEPPPNDDAEFDPLEELARSEGSGVNEISGRRASPDFAACSAAHGTGHRRGPGSARRSSPGHAGCAGSGRGRHTGWTWDGDSPRHRRRPVPGSRPGTRVDP